MQSGINCPKTPQNHSRQQRKTKLSELHLSDCHLADFGDEMLRFAEFMKNFSGSLASCRGRPLQITNNVRVRSPGRIRIRISDLWRSFGANPFWDQWSIKSTLDKDLPGHWSAWSEDGLLEHWSNAFLWVMDSKIIILPKSPLLNMILPSDVQFQTCKYFIYAKYFRDVSRVRDFRRRSSSSW